LAGYYGFNANISFTFQAVKNLSAVFGCFVKSFSQRISKIYGKRKF